MGKGRVTKLSGPGEWCEQVSMPTRAVSARGKEVDEEGRGTQSLGWQQVEDVAGSMGEFMGEQRPTGKLLSLLNYLEPRQQRKHCWLHLWPESGWGGWGSPEAGAGPVAPSRGESLDLASETFLGKMTVAAGRPGALHLKAAWPPVAALSGLVL